MTSTFNTLAILCFAAAVVVYAVRTFKAFKRDGLKRGLIAKGNWHLWGIGTALLIVGFGFHSLANHYAGDSSELTSERQALVAAMSEPVETHTPPTSQPGQSSPVGRKSVSGSSEKSGQSRLTTADALPPDAPRALWALRHAGASSAVGGAIDYDTFPYPTSSGVKSPDGYPEYLIECNASTHQCVGPTGHPIGDASMVADQLTPVRSADALRFHCPDWVCTDARGDVVGAVSPAMRHYLAQRHR